MELNYFHAVSPEPLKVKHMLSITEPDSEISYSYKKIVCVTFERIPYKRETKKRVFFF